MTERKLTTLEVERIRRRWSLDMAAKEVGISRQWYYFIEMGKIEPSPEIAEKIEKTFEKKIGELLKEV